MKVLVLGGTGTVGSQVTRELLQRKQDVSVLTRHPEKARSLPEGARGVVGDLIDPDGLRQAMRGHDGVFLLNGLGPTEAHEGLQAVCAARLEGVKRLVYLSVQHVDQAPHLPHFGSKIAVETAVKASGIPFTIVRPSNYYQNDYWFKDVLLKHGVYPQPLGGKGVSRVDVRDIAEAVASAFTTEPKGETLDLVGPEPLTGSSTAETWSRALGKPIAYAGDDLDAWEAQARQGFPAYLAFDLRLMYEHFQKNGLIATSADVERFAKVLGHAPRRYEDFARETAAQWKS